MTKRFFDNLYRLMMVSLCFAIALIFIRVLPFEWLSYSIAYDILAICYGFLVAIILMNFNRLKALCIAFLLFMGYFLFFKVPLMAIATILCAFVLQVLSLYLRDTIKFILIPISLSVLLLVAYSSDSMRLSFLLRFVFLWHTLWFALLFIVLNIIKTQGKYH